jgi:hypothetical protein
MKVLYRLLVLTSYQHQLMVCYLPVALQFKSFICTCLSLSPMRRVFMFHQQNLIPFYPPSSLLSHISHEKACPANSNPLINVSSDLPRVVVSLPCVPSLPRSNSTSAKFNSISAHSVSPTSSAMHMLLLRHLIAVMLMDFLLLPE